LEQQIAALAIFVGVFVLATLRKVHIGVLMFAAAAGDVPISIRDGFFALDARWYFPGRHTASVSDSDAHEADRTA